MAPLKRNLSSEELGTRVQERLHQQGRLMRVGLDEVAKHSSKDDAWIVVNAKVYDITRHVQNHPGWNCGCAVSELLAILRTLGTDCSEEFASVHSEAAKTRLQPFLIGVLTEA